MKFLVAESTSLNLLRTRCLFGAAVLAALVLGVMTLLWLRRSAAGQSGIGAALHRWWGEECWLGGPFGAAWRQIMAQGWFTVTFALYMLRWIIGDASGLSFPTRLLTDLLFWGIAAKLLLFTRYSARQLCAAAVFLLPFLLAASATGSQQLLYHALFLFCVKDIDLRRAFAVAFWVVAAAVTAVMLLAAFGCIPSHVMGRNGARLRFALGFGHPNTAGKYLMYLASGWLMLRFDRLRWYDWLGMAALFLLCSSIVDSRSNSLAILTMLTAGALARRLPRFWHSRPLQWLGLAGPSLAAAVSFAIAFLYRAGEPVWDRLNALSSDRLELFHMASKLPVTLFGQEFLTEDLYTLDNLYLNNFYSLGVIGALAYFVLLSWALFRCWERGWSAETAALLGFLVYGLFERGSWVNTNPALLLLAGAVCWPGQKLRISRGQPAGGGGRSRPGGGGIGFA